MAQLNSFLAAQRTIGNPQQTIRAIEQALGPQKITVGGVSATTHFARVLVAADFRMKRIAMGFDPSPVKDLPSYLQMVSAGSVGRGPQSAMPRWWLEAKYEPVSTDGDGLAWRLKPAAVECLTENDFVAADGTRRTSDKANPQAQKWAATMTKNYDERAKADSTFGQLRSIMDLAVVAALIKKEGLVGFANLEIPTLMGSEYVQYFNAPKEVASIASFIRKGNNWIISASGGVKFQPWQMADNTKQDKSVLTEREKISTQVGSARWWWN